MECFSMAASMTLQCCQTRSVLLRVTGQPHSTAAAASCNAGPTCTRGTKASVKVRRTASKVTSVEAAYRDGGGTLAVTVYSRCAPARVGDPTRRASVTESPAIHPVRVLLSVPLVFSVSRSKDPIPRRGEKYNVHSFSQSEWKRISGKARANQSQSRMPPEHDRLSPVRHSARLMRRRRLVS